jgi:hypothetical protein
MTVLTYVYPQDIDALSVERLLPAVRKKVAHVAIAELHLKKHATPDWESLTFSHPAAPEAQMLFVVARNSKDNVGALRQRYGGEKKFSVIQNAPVLIWAQHRAPLRLSPQGFEQSWSTFNELLAAIAEASDALVDSPEAERLFTPQAFRQHLRKNRPGH